MPAKDETRVEKLEGQVRSICSELEKHKTENSNALASLKHEVKTDIENLSHKLHSAWKCDHFTCMRIVS